MHATAAQKTAQTRMACATMQQQRLAAAAMQTWLLALATHILRTALMMWVE